jgi:hypothetical protein
MWPLPLTSLGSSGSSWNNRLGLPIHARHWVGRFRRSASVVAEDCGTGRGAFIDSVLTSVDSFYGEVVQNLKAWSATPPRMREAEVPDERPALTSTLLSSQDGPELIPATDGSQPLSLSGEVGRPPFEV